MILKAIASGVGIYSPHTACDNCINGGKRKYLYSSKPFFLFNCVVVNDWLASGLGKGRIEPITPTINPPEGQEGAGSGRLFTFDEPVSLPVVVDRVKKLIGLPFGNIYSFFFFSCTCIHLLCIYS